jgi:hypothetical protein
MKKVYLVLSFIAFTIGATAQTISNASFETWRVGSAGVGSFSKVVRAPTTWYGADSLIIQLGQTIGPLLGINDTVWQQQLFKDSLSVHSGTYSAKLVTKLQDTLGIFPGVLSNAAAHVNFSGTTFNSLTYTGGTAITYRVNSVSAWAKYTRSGASDSGVLTVQVLGHYGSITDSVLGTGIVKIGPSTSFNQYTANITYTVPDSLVDTVRITFTSSKGGTSSSPNSTMYVDDVSMTGTPFSVKELAANGKMVNVYPNPATNLLHLDTKSSATITCNLISATGQVVATKRFTGNNTMDISTIPSGLYYYSIAGDNGNTTQTGSISIVK